MDCQELGTAQIQMHIMVSALRVITWSCTWPRRMIFSESESAARLVVMLSYRSDICANTFLIPPG